MIHQLPYSSAPRALCGERLHVYTGKDSPPFTRAEHAPKFTTDTRAVDCPRCLDNHETYKQD